MLASEDAIAYISAMTSLIRIGTRASKLARVQAEMLQAALASAHPQLTFETIAMTTAGDRELHKTLSDWGYKGLFTKELEDALFEDRIDLAVHSMKDMPSILPEGLIVAAMLPRAEVRDAWISPHYAQLSDMPAGSVVGTSSTRRAAQLLYQRSDLTVVPLRGNVQTRLQKLADGAAQATFLAAAGLTRLGLQENCRSLLPVEDFLPAAAQGAIGIECRETRADIRALLSAINHAPTSCCVTAERAMLRVLDGSCRTPIGGLATLKADGTLHLRGEVLSLDGRIRHFAERVGDSNDPESLGVALGNTLRAAAGEALLRHG